MKKPLMMTKKIYYADPYKTEHEATILGLLDEEGKILLVTDESIFYPEGGGQPADHGTINGIEVLDVQESDGIIYHQLAGRPVGDLAQMKIEWARRYDLMQQHTGEHLLSGLFLKELGGSNKGFHLGADFVTIDIDIPKLSWEQLMRVENLANRKILENKAIREEMTDRSGLARFPIRKQVTAEGELRIVSIADADCCACCGTHVRSLAEVGTIKILKTEQYKGMTRIHFVCGMRAQQDYARRFEITRDLKRLLNADEERIVERVMLQKEEMERIKKRLYEQKLLLAEFIAKQCMEENEGNSIFRIFESYDSEQLALVENILNRHYDTIVLGSGVEKKLMAFTKTQVDFGMIFKENLVRFGARGGGKGARAQAVFENADAMEHFVQALRERIA